MPMLLVLSGVPVLHLRAVRFFGLLAGQLTGGGWCLTTAPDIAVICTINNSGAGPASNFEVAINKNSSSMDCDTAEDAAGVIVSLAGGVSTSGSLQLVLPQAVGTYTASIMADSDCQLAEEINPDDNTRQTTYDVNGFDLSASFVGGSWNK